MHTTPAIPATQTAADDTESVLQCATCGVEYTAVQAPLQAMDTCALCVDGRESPMAHRMKHHACPICVDERQYVPADGQQWARPRDFAGEVTLTQREPGLWAIDVSGGAGIGQQAKIIVTDGGTVMVDVPAAITSDAVRAVRALGPMAAIIPSHPHMFGLQSLWSRELGDVPVYVSAADESWLGRRPGNLKLWSDRIEPAPGVVATQPGGHFPGSSVVHWAGADGAGVLLAGDTIFVNPDRRTASFMRSYPNRIPLSAAVAERIAAHVNRYEFDRLYSNFEPHLSHDAKAKVLASARRHAAWVRGDFDHLTGPG
jgi:hypothetical protein